MAPELNLAQARCTTPSLVFPEALPASGVTPERTGVSTDDHGWEKYGGNSGFNLHHIGSSFEAPSTLPSPYGWWLGYYFTNGQPSDGQYEEVVRFTLALDNGSDNNNIAVRLYNDSGTYKFRLWNATDDAQIGSDSAGVTVGQTMLVNCRADSVAETLTLFLDGSSIISASLTMHSVAGGMVAGVSSSTASRYWSAWCLYVSASDDLNEAHYPEMRLIHPDAEFEGSASPADDYTDGIGGGAGTADWSRWDDLANEGDPDSIFNAGPDLANQLQLSHLTTHTMTNTIMGIGMLYWLRQSAASKSVLHRAAARIFDDPTINDKVISFGTEDIGTDFVVREAVMHTPPGGSSPADWTQGKLDELQAGHRRNAGSAALVIEVKAMGVVAVALGTTNLAPSDPPDKASTIVGSAGQGAALGSANAMMV